MSRGFFRPFSGEQMETGSKLKSTPRLGPTGTVKELLMGTENPFHAKKNFNHRLRR